MSRICRILIVVCVFTIPLWAEYTIYFSRADFTIHKENGFDRIAAQRCAHVGSPGEPEMPAVYYNYIIPPSVHVADIVVKNSEVSVIPGHYKVYPAQKAISSNEMPVWTPPDNDVYHSEARLPGYSVRFIGEGIMDGARIATIEVRPLQYCPRSEQLLIVNRIDFDFIFSNTSIPEIRASIRGKVEQGAYDAALRSTVVNDNEINAYYQKPAIVDFVPVNESRQCPLAPAAIITPYQFFTKFQPYADWLTDRGISTVLVTPQEIYISYSGDDEADDIRLYITDCYEHAGGTYFILGGDSDFLPIRKCWMPTEGVGDPQDSIVCDMYFSDLTGEWDSNHNGIYGEWSDDPDRYPEVFVGRVTACADYEVTQWVKKALRYEQNPEVDFTNALWIQGDIDIGDAPEVFPNHFTTSIILHDNAKEIVDTLSHGFNIYNIHSHGLRNRFCNGDDNYKVWAYWGESGGTSNDGLNHLRNVTKPNIVYSVSCYNAAFDEQEFPYNPPTDTCVVDAFIDAYEHELIAQPIGACAFLGYTRESIISGHCQDLEYEFYKAFFTDINPDRPIPFGAYSALGVAEALSKCGERIDWNGSMIDRHNCYAHNLFGSPATEAWTNVPGMMSVIHPSTIPVRRLTRFGVIVRDAETGSYVPYATVCLNKSDDLYEVGTTDCRGRAIFIICPETLGTMKVTVTRFHNYDNIYEQYVPSQTECQVTDSDVSGGVQEDGGAIIKQFVFAGAQSNPSIGVLRIKFTSPDQRRVVLRLYDVTGREIEAVFNGKAHIGENEIFYSAKNLSDGIYFLRCETGDRVITQKVIIQR
jgi:hypothetical protein